MGILPFDGSHLLDLVAGYQSTICRAGQADVALTTRGLAGSTVVVEGFLPVSQSPTGEGKGELYK